MESSGMVLLKLADGQRNRQAGLLSLKTSGVIMF